MKNIGRFLVNALITVWIIVAIFVTICLLSYNEFKVTTFGNTALIIIDSDELEPDYLEGDLLIVKRNSDAKINEGDAVFYYNSDMDSNVLLLNGVVESKESIDKNETTFIINDNKVSGSYVAGKIDGSKSYHTLGKILGILTSKWGFMFLIIFPTLFVIIYEILMIVEARREIKREEAKEKE